MSKLPLFAAPKIVHSGRHFPHLAGVNTLTWRWALCCKVRETCGVAIIHQRTIKRTPSLLPGAAVCTVSSSQRSNRCSFVRLLMISSAVFLAAMDLLEPFLVPVFPPSVAQAGIREHASLAHCRHSGHSPVSRLQPTLSIIVPDTGCKGPCTSRQRLNGTNKS